MEKSCFEKFMALDVDKRVIGLEESDDYDDFCIPIGAKIFAGLGVDGVQFCMIDGFDDMVFSISPYALYNKYVNPLSYHLKISLAWCYLARIQILWSKSIGAMRMILPLF